MSPRLLSLLAPAALVACAALAVSVIAIGLRASWRAWRLSRRYVTADSLIRGASRTFDGHDEGLPTQARERRERAERYRRAAVRLETGSPASAPSTDRVVAMPARR